MGGISSAAAGATELRRTEGDWERAEQPMRGVSNASVAGVAASVLAWVVAWSSLSDGKADLVVTPPVVFEQRSGTQRTFSYSFSCPFVENPLQGGDDDDSQLRVFHYNAQRA